MSTPSDTMRTATSQRSSEPSNAASRRDAVGSSDRTTTGGCPVIVSSVVAYSRAVFWSVAMTIPAASGIPPARFCVNRRSAACSTAGTQSPAGSSAVRQAAAVASRVSGSPSVAVISSPARVRQVALPL